MDPETAKIIGWILVVGGIGWTVLCRVFLREEWATSHFLFKIGNSCPPLNTLFMLLAYTLICDAFPGVNHWDVLLVVISMYLMGHAQWPLDR